jgi:hypothetical protein
MGIAFTLLFWACILMGLAYWKGRAAGFNAHNCHAAAGTAPEPPEAASEELCHWQRRALSAEATLLAAGIKP